MAKIKTAFICGNCGHSSPKWAGKCPSCEEWNSFSEEIVSSSAKTSIKRKTTIEVETIASIQYDNTERKLLDDPELNRVLGGGLVGGSIILLAGEPGIGKSTLSLQIANNPLKVLYVSGEESKSQIKMRADRMNITNPELYILDVTNVGDVLAVAEDIKPDLLIIDSIQTMRLDALESAPGSVSQIRECTGQLQRYAKDNGRSVLVVGHITKEGSIAGPKLLEHMVDVVLNFEGLKQNHYRMIRAFKNRFGSTQEIGVYEMVETGLNPVENPSKLLIDLDDRGLSGSAVGVMSEGMRPILIECQALVTKAVYGTPQRSSTGYDAKRLNMLLAVLEKKCGLPIGACDVFLNIVGGIRVTDPALDLAVIAALVSSLEDVPLPKTNCFFGEVGLSGEIRAVSKFEYRLNEAERLGFERVFVPNKNKVDRSASFVISLNTIEELLARLIY